MNEEKRAQNTAKAVEKACGKADIGVILGSGLDAFAQILTDAKKIAYAEIEGFPRATAPGHAGEFASGTLQGKKVIVMRGRFHGYEGYSMRDITLPVRVMSLLQVKTLIVTNAAGGVNTGFTPGDLMLMTDFINLSGKNPLRGENLDTFGPRFPDMSCAFDEDLRRLAIQKAEALGIQLRQGVYIWMNGPCFETPAEIRMARILGADAVGMSTVPEVIVARHCGMRVLGISCITNMASGILSTPITHAEVLETGERVKNRFRELLTAIISEI